MIKKIICMGVMLVMIFSLCSCRDEFAPDKVSIMIKAEYREKFEAEEFFLEDFKWDNVERFTYGKWYDKSSRGGMVVYLKKHGKKHVFAAVEHFKTLEFVEIAEVVGYTRIYNNNQ